MAASVGVGYVTVLPDAKGFTRKLRAELGDVGAIGDDAGKKIGDGIAKTGEDAGRRTGKNLTAGLGSSVKSSAAQFRGMGMAIGSAVAVGAGVAAVGLFKLGKASVTASSDLNESLNAVNVTFGDSAEGIKQLGKQAATSLGLSQAAFNGLAVQFSNFATTVAGPGGDVVQIMDDLTTRAADFASVMNLDVAEAATLFQSGLAGETEPLRQYGIDLSAAAVEAYAMANGIGQAGRELTEAEKVQARYGLLMQSTAKTQGDFANTSTGMANQQRILNAEWSNFKTVVGQALVPIIERYLPMLVQGVQWASGYIQANMPAIQGAMTGFADKVIAAYPQVRDWLIRAATAVRDNWPQIVQTANDLRAAVERVWQWTGVLWQAWQALPPGVKQTLAMLAIAQKTGVLKVGFEVVDMAKTLFQKFAGVGIQAGVVNVTQTGGGVGGAPVAGGASAAGKTALTASGLGFLGFWGYSIAAAAVVGSAAYAVLRKIGWSDKRIWETYRPSSLAIPGMATGGVVPGVGNRDSVPAMLMPGEFVIRKQVAQSAGLPAMREFNATGRLPGAAPITVNVYNPVPEPTSESLPRAIRRASQLQGAGR